MKEFVDAHPVADDVAELADAGRATSSLLRSNSSVHSKCEGAHGHCRLLMAANIAFFFKKFLLPYASHFRSRGWQVDAMANGFYDRDHTWNQSFDNIYEVQWARKPHKIKGSRNIVHRIREIADQGRYDIIHVHTPVAAMLTRFAMRHPKHRGRTQVIYTAHGFHFFTGASPVGGTLYKKLETMACRWTDYLVVMNQEDYDAALSLKMVPEKRLRYMPGIGIDLKHYVIDPATREKTRLKTRAELQIEDSEILLSCIAEFIPRKRQQDLLAALAKTEVNNVKIAFAGTGETFEKAKKEARQMGLSDRTIFLGHVPDVRGLITASDATVLPSSQEGLPRSVMESMAAAVPVIATDVRGSRDLLGDGGGLLYEMGNIDQLATLIAEMATRPEQAKVLGESAQKLVRKYDFDRVLAMHEELYAEAIGRANAYAI